MSAAVAAATDHEVHGSRQRHSGEVLLVSDGTDSNQSLQQRFLRFKRERQQERALAKRQASQLLATGQGAAERDLEALRRRFVEICMSYVGVPYGQKFHEPPDPDYNAPLFLDCCALVRQTARDMQQDLGFRIGSWNQAYQFETLTKSLTFEELKPGDLVFVEGTYFDERKKAQRHNIVHVEVFIGGATGEATVGSRWPRSDPTEGKVRGVQVHDSYRYSSKNYKIHAFHFRSLDTWLQGKCRSWSYADATVNAETFGGKSIFEDGDQDADNVACEDEDGAFTPDPYKDAPVCYVGEGNNWRVVADALEQRGWQRLPFEAAFSCRFDLKWVEQRAKIDYARHVEGQLVNHIPNNDIITAKKKFLETMRAHEAATGEKFRYHPSSYTSERMGDKLMALEEAEQFPEAAWILKPSRGLGGKGIEIVKGAASLRERLMAVRDMAEEPAAAGPPREGWVIQRYIERPLLLQGRKFDLRVYCLVARTTPHHLWYFRPGYCKVALQAYDPDDFSCRYVHLTNACVQRAHPEFRGRGQHIWSLADAEADLLATGRWSPEGGPFWQGHVHTQMKEALVWIFEASCRQLERRKGYFDLMGVDFMLDEDFNVHLLEMNSNPSLFFESSPVLHEMIPDLIGSSLGIVLDAQRPGCEEQRPEAPEPWELIIDEAADFKYGQ